MLGKTGTARARRLSAAEAAARVKASLTEWAAIRPGWLIDWIVLHPLLCSLLVRV